MGQYSDMFNKAGFTHLKQVATEDDLDLNDMGVKLIGHKNKIRKSLREVKKTLSRDTAFWSSKWLKTRAYEPCLSIRKVPLGFSVEILLGILGGTPHIFEPVYLLGSFHSFTTGKFK